MILDDAVSLIPKAYKKLKNKLFGKNTPLQNTNIYSPMRFTKESMSGISNFDIEEIFIRGDNQDLLKNFVAVFLSDKMNRFFDFKKLMK